MSLRIAVIEDDARYRDSLGTLFENAPGFALAGLFPAAERALAWMADAALRPFDLVLMDIDLPGMSGIEATRRVRAAFPEAQVVMLTVFEDPKTILQAICAGADGYLLKRTSAPELLAQLRGIAAGGAPLTAGVARAILGLMRDLAPPDAAGPTAARLDLTDRERDVLRGLVRGQSYKQAAADLSVSIDTVRTHVRGLYRKLQVHSVAAAVSRAVREGLV